MFTAAAGFATGRGAPSRGGPHGQVAPPRPDCRFRPHDVGLHAHRNAVQLHLHRPARPASRYVPRRGRAGRRRRLLGGRPRQSVGLPVPTQTPDSWITITQEVPDRGLGFRITAAANPGSARRTGIAYVGYQALTVDQAGTGGSGCTFQLIPASSSFTTPGGTGAFVIVASDPRCGWSAERTSTGEDWSGEPHPNRGVGTTGLVFDVRSGTAAPQPPLPRQAAIRVTDSANVQVGSHAYAQQ